MRSGILVSAAALAFFSIFLTLNPDIGPPGSSSTGAAAAAGTTFGGRARDVLHGAELLHLNGTAGPESFAFDAEGRGPYTGVADGRILRWGGAARGWEDFATVSPYWNRERCDLKGKEMGEEEVCGRPLGLQFHEATGDLYVADAYFGLLVVGEGGGAATQLAVEADGEPFRFTNHLDIDQVDDTIYFTDSSSRFSRRQFAMSVASGDSTGRLMSYDPKTKEVKVLLKGLKFANGVALSRDRSFILVIESSGCRVTRLWLKGPNAGKTDVFAHLPGYPDNVKRNSAGEFWVALHGRKGPLSVVLQYDSWLKRAILKLPLNFQRLHKLFMRNRSQAMAIKLSEDGEVLDVLEDREGKSLKFISEVEEFNGDLWVGSVIMPYAGLYKL
ncbi:STRICTOSIDINE SYNTHASE-LIKE 10 protein [Nymphaea thermarum]|nr:STRICTOSIDINE SYNTHASE-LIKE 10 protein [Nymphaea thermarum]